MTWLDFILAALATYRLSLMISEENGPAWMFLRLRRSIPKRSSAHQGIRCQWCVSMWMASVIGSWIGVRSHFSELAQASVNSFILCLALSGAAVCLNQQFTKG